MARRTNQRFIMRCTRDTFSFRAMTYQFEPRLAYARTLPSAYYFDAAVFDAENRNIFAKSWQLAGRAEQVREGGEFFTATVANEPLLIVRGSDGELRALSNVCRH